MIAHMTEALSWVAIGERVRESRASARLSQQELADRIGLERSMVSKLETGDRRIDAMELTLIARELDYPVSHFLSPTPELVSRRASAVAESGEVGEADTTRAAYRTESLLAAWLRDVRQLVDTGMLENRPLLRYASTVSDRSGGREAALWLRAELGLGREPVESVADACERSGQFVAVVPLDTDGASLIDGDISVAVVNARLEPGRKRSTVAHELGHMVLGDEFSSDLGVHASRDEREAVIEAFAAEFLLPHDQMRTVEGRKGQEERRQELIRLSATYRVSWSLALAQLRQTDTVDRGFLNRMRARTPTVVEFKEALGWKPLPDLDKIRVSPRYASAVMAAVREHGITKHRAVEMMRGEITLEDLTEE